MWKSVLRLCFLLLFSVSNAQTLNSKLFNYFDGMPSDDISWVYTTRDGYLGMCSAKGITAFDGHRFYLENAVNQAVLNAYFYENTLYYEDGQALYEKDYNKKGLTTLIQSKKYTDADPNNDHFENIFVDSKKRIWCTDFNQVKYIFNKETFYYSVFPDNTYLNIKVRFVEISPQEIWVFTPGGLYKWHENTNQLTESGSAFITGLSIEAVVKVENELIIAAKDRMLYVDIPTLSVKKSISLPGLSNIYQLAFHKNDLFVLTEHELFLLTEDRLQLLFASANFKFNHFLYTPSTNNYWIATSKGLLQIHLPKKGITSISLPQTFQKKNNFILDVVEIQPGSYVVATSANQLLLYSYGKWELLYEFSQNIQIKSLLKHNGIYITTTDGIFCWEQNFLRKLKLKDFLPNKEIVKSRIVHNQLWILYEHQEIERYNLESGQRLLPPFTNTITFWTSNKWNDLLQDSKGNIWLAGWMPKGFGICLLHKQNNAFEDISGKKFKNTKDLFVGDYYNRIFDTGSDLLFSAYGGFNSVSYQGKLLKKADVFSYAIDDTYVTGLTTDTHGNVYFATNAGLHIYLKQYDNVVKLNTTDGLPSNNLQYAFTSVSNNRLVVGAENAFVSIDKKQVLESTLLNRFEITKVLVNGKPFDAKKHALVLQKNQNNISIYFSTFSYLENSKIFYEYSINEGEWISLGNQAELLFNYLPPGTYAVKIKAKDYLGNEQKKQLYFYIHITPPFTQSTIFYLIIGMVSLIVIYSLFRYSVYRKTKEKRYQLKIKEAEMKMLRAQMNPHFMFNTLNSINSYIIQNKTADASKYLGAFSKLMRNILESSKQQFVPLEQEIKTTKLYIQLEIVRLDHSFDFEVSTDNVSAVQEIMVPPLIVQPFAENAIWHGLRHLSGKRGNLTIRFLMFSATVLQIDIEDNGIGREKSSTLKAAKKHTSYGVQITEARIKALHRDNFLNITDLYDETGRPAGTKVSIYLNIDDYDKSNIDR